MGGNVALCRMATGRRPGAFHLAIGPDQLAPLEGAGLDWEAKLPPCDPDDDDWANPPYNEDDRDAGLDAEHEDRRDPDALYPGMVTPRDRQDDVVCGARYRATVRSIARHSATPSGSDTA
jgi:hypothetical protein